MDPNNTHEVIFWDNLYKLRPWLLQLGKKRNFDTIWEKFKRVWTW